MVFSPSHVTNDELLINHGSAAAPPGLPGYITQVPRAHALVVLHKFATEEICYSIPS